MPSVVASDVANVDLLGEKPVTSVQILADEGVVNIDSLGYARVLRPGYWT